MRKVTFFVGQGYKHDLTPLENEEIGQGQTDSWQYLNETFGGFTALVGMGGWVNTKGLSVTEPSILLVVFTDQSDRTLENAAKFLREAFKQDSVLFTVENAPEVRSI